MAYRQSPSTAPTRASAATAAVAARRKRGPRHSRRALGSLDCVCTHAAKVDAAHLGVARDHGLQARRPHFHSFLGHVIEPGVLERGKQIMQIQRDALLAGARFDAQHSYALSRMDEGGAPFSFPAVENQYGISGLEP